jgi:hypothetical protein
MTCNRYDTGDRKSLESKKNLISAVLVVPLLFRAEIRVEKLETRNMDSATEETDDNSGMEGI